MVEDNFTLKEIEKLEIERSAEDKHAINLKNENNLLGLMLIRQLRFLIRWKQSLAAVRVKASPWSVVLSCVRFKFGCIHSCGHASVEASGMVHMLEM
jgi:hypothetical protein